MHIEEDFLKSIHDAQFGICHATGTFAENIRSGKDDGRKMKWLKVLLHKITTRKGWVWNCAIGAIPQGRDEVL